MRAIFNFFLQMTAHKLLVNEQIYQEIFNKHLLLAEKSVLIATANVKNIFIKKNREYISIVQIFKELCNNDIYVSLLFSSEPSQSFLDELHKLKLYKNKNFYLTKCPRTHFKCVIIDDKIAYTGSANLTGAGIGAKSIYKRNFEIGFMTDEKNVIQNMIEIFMRITERKECGGCKRKEFCSEII
ncbi:MAG TPA: phospholipase D-like domain-containing protein [bacterium]|nr:phospholipase D-like domain-containing protein [bacterium]